MPGSEKEKRRTPRIQPFVAPCRLVEGERTHAGYLLDLSPRGARVSSGGSLAEGTESVVLEVRLGRLKTVSRLPARVRWTTPGTQRGEAAVVGLVFDSLPASGEQLLESVIREFRRLAAQLA